jgi:hypothetical protein
MGAQERLWSPEGKRSAAAYFQKAAGMLLYIRDVLNQRFKISLDPNSDLHESSLSSLATLMLAQAAECFYEKANDDESTSMLTAVVAIYVSDLYDVTLKPIKQCSTFLKQKVPKKILLHIKAKHHLYAAIAQFHTKAVTSNERAVAERLARRVVGKRFITLALGYAQEVGGLLHEHVQAYAEMFTTALLALDSANHEIIHETPFDERLLAPLRRPPEALVNPIEPKHVLELVKLAPDVLEGLISSTQHVALQEVLCESRKLAHDGQAKLKALIEHYGKPFPSLGPLPSEKITEVRFAQVRLDSKRLLDELDEFQGMESLLSTKDAISCLRKIDNYTIGNIQESFEILQKLIKEGKKDASSLHSLQSILVTVKEKQREQSLNTKKVQSHLEFYEKNIADFDVSNWSADKIKTLVSLSDSNSQLFSELQEKWVQISKVVEKEKSAIKDLVQLCNTLNGDLKKLPNTSWAANKSHSMSELIRERKSLIKDLDKKCESIAPLFEESVKSIKAQEADTKYIIQVLDELHEESKIVESFQASLGSFMTFHRTLQIDAKEFLHFRNQSCRLLYLCLELNHQDCEEYIKGSKIARDPHLLTLIRNSEHITEKLTASEDPLNLDQLILVLRESQILPLHDVFGHQESFQNFWKAIHERAAPKEIQEESKKKPGVLERRELFDQIPFAEELVLDIDSGPRRPTQSAFGRRMPSYHHEQNTVHFQDEPTKNPNIGGVLSSLWKAKDALIGLVSSKKTTPQLQPRKSSRNPFQNLDSRKSSHSSALEMSTIHSAEDLNQDVNPEVYIQRVMKENSRLRAEVMNIRNDLQQEKEGKISELEQRLRLLERKHRPKSERKNSKSKAWVLNEDQMVQSPTSSASRLNSSQSLVTDSEKSGINRATSIAAAVVAGINAVEHLNRKPKPKKEKKDIVQTRMVFASDPNFAEIELKHAAKSPQKRDYLREDSGIHRSTRASDDEIGLRKKGKSILIQISIPISSCDQPFMR